MIETTEYCLIGIGVGTVCGICIGICSVILKHYKEETAHKTDVENITKNILHILDEETSFGDVAVVHETPDITCGNYMESRPIV
jgi:hypothetical protein